MSSSYGMGVTMKDDRVFEMIMIACIWLLFIVMATAILKPLKNREPVVRTPPVIEQGRTIPKCDKELWLRVKDGCEAVEVQDSSTTSTGE